MKGSSAALSSDGVTPLSFTCLASINYFGNTTRGNGYKCDETGLKRVIRLSRCLAGEAHDVTAERAITVSMPYFGCRPFLRRAVESILAQTHNDLP